MEIKIIEIPIEQSDIPMKCICINYEKFLSDCEGFVMERYQKFKCNPKNQFDTKAMVVLNKAIKERYFLPELFSIRLNKKQSTCNSQIEFAFELMNKSFLELDYIRQRELSNEVLKKCISQDVEFIMIYIGMNR
ncbi:hypothetical protein [Clostridium perfringens]|uniref:hypothetical protein n=1 Tax=Clostridium perfringens TaxID=1502 RepID=UPI001ABB2E82|nr:hypothetical protein [Clostridium perfringens]MBO3404479.1 hypothetical protein [Clostridium perfringens]